MWRFKLTSLLIVVLTLGAGVAVIKLTPPVFTASSSYLLVAPPDPPTADQFAADPALRRAHYENPYNRYQNPGVILEVVARTATSEQMKQRVVDGGGDDRYEVAPEASFGAGSSIMDIAATGDSSDEVMRTLQMVSESVLSELKSVQVEEDVDPQWMFTTRLIEQPESATRVLSGTMRALVGMVALGGLALVVVISLRLAAANRKRAREQARPRPAEVVTDDPIDMTKSVRSMRRRPLVDRGEGQSKTG
jgi:hypothetical protein